MTAGAYRLSHRATLVDGSDYLTPVKRERNDNKAAHMATRFSKQAVNNSARTVSGRQQRNQEGRRTKLTAADCAIDHSWRHRVPRQHRQLSAP